MSLSPNIGNMFNPTDFYHLASVLYSTQNQHGSQLKHALYRTIIGRAYYAALLAAREASDVKSTSGNVHAQIIDYWESRHQMIANRLRDLKKRREAADYLLSRYITHRDAGEALKRAKQILKDLNIQI